jgi:gluconolactonase
VRLSFDARRGLSVLAHCEHPNGLAPSPDERTMYVANTRSSQYIHGITLDAAGHHGRTQHLRRYERRHGARIPDGLKVDSIGRVYCTGPSGIWLMSPVGKRVGIIN